MVCNDECYPLLGNETAGIGCGLPLAERRKVPNGCLLIESYSLWGWTCSTGLGEAITGADYGLIYQLGQASGKVDSATGWRMLVKQMSRRIQVDSPAQLPYESSGCARYRCRRGRNSRCASRRPPLDGCPYERIPCARTCLAQVESAKVTRLLRGMSQGRIDFSLP